MATMTEHAAKLQALTDRGERLMARVEAILDRGASETSAEVDAAVERAEAAMQQAEAMLDAAEAAG